MNNDPQPTSSAPHPQPPRFRRFDEALYWLADHGWRQVGAKAIAESIRFDAAIRGLPAEGETYRWNNNYTSRMARKAIADEPELAGFFELRELRSA